MPIDLSKIKKKINPTPDGQDVLRLRTAVIAARDASTGRVSITLNDALVTDVPVLGAAVFTVGTSVQVLSYRGSLLILGGSNAASAVPVEATGNTTLGSTTSTSFTNSLTTTGVHGVAFIAPPSGIVQIFGRAGGGNDTVGQYSLLDHEVRQGSTVGSGTVYRATTTDTASVFMSSTSAGQGPLNIVGLVSGMTPGAVYNASLTYACTAGTARFNRRYILVRPQ